MEPSLEPSEEPSLFSRPQAIVIQEPVFGPEEAGAVWNAFANRFGLAAVRSVEDKRLSALKRNLARHGAADWHEALTAISRSDFLLGKRENGRVTFDWLIKPGNFAKVLEGNYRNGNPIKGDGVTRAIWNSFANAGGDLCDTEIPF